MMQRTWVAAATAAASIFFAGAATAAAPVYPHYGSENPTTYTFTARNTGDVIGYFAGSTAAYTETVGLMVNGVMPTTYGLNDHTSSLGQAFDFGKVNKGDTLVFVLNTVENGHHLAYSDPSLNAPYDYNSVGSNHVYSVAYNGEGLGGGIPKGTYVAFEDLTPWWTDYNYHDDTFVFTNTASVPSGPSGGPGSVPEPESWAMMTFGFGLLGATRRARRARQAAARQAA